MDYTYTSILPLVVLWIIATLSGYIAWLAYTVCVYDLPSRIAASIGGIAILLMSALPIIDFIREQSDLKEWACVTLGIGLAGIWFAAITICCVIFAEFSPFHNRSGGADSGAK